MCPNSKLVKCLYLVGAGFSYLFDETSECANTGLFAPFLFVCAVKLENAIQVFKI